ncbi:MAG: DUF29 domain-containing protein [Geminicoccaceae bacterium]
MATRVRPKAEKLYEQDFYVWTEVQAELLRERRFEALDLANLIEEVEDLGAALKRAVRSRARTIMAHLLKLQHSRAVEPRAGWRQTVTTQRNDLADELTPTLRREVASALDELYGRARQEAEIALRDHDEPTAAEALLANCPYSLEQITGDWWP